MRDDAAGGWRLTGQKTWTTRGAFCTHLFGLFRTDPAAERHRGLTYFLVRSTRRASRCAASAGSTATRASPRCSSTTCSCPTPTCSASVGPGLAGRDGHDRFGARPHAALPGPVPRRPPSAWSTLAREHGAELDPACASGSSGRGSTPRRTAVHTCRRSRGLVDGGRPGAESSLNKVFWSELDVALHETALELLGPRRRQLDAAVDEGLPVRARRARSTPAPTRSSATSSPSACSACRGAEGACDSRSPRTRRDRATRSATCSRRGARRRWCARPWPAGGRRRRSVGGAGARWGCSRRAVPEADGGLGLAEVDLVPVLEELGYARGAATGRRDDGRRPRRCSAVDDPAGPLRRAAGEAGSTPAGPDADWSPTAASADLVVSRGDRPARAGRTSVHGADGRTVPWPDRAAGRRRIAAGDRPRRAAALRSTGPTLGTAAQLSGSAGGCSS